MKIAFDIANLKSLNNQVDNSGKYFTVGQDKVECFGAKILVAGNDISFHNFVQEYTKACLDLKDTKNSDLNQMTQVYLLPYSYNSIASFIASREPLYRQNVYQFFSGLSPAYNKLIKPNGSAY